MEQMWVFRTESWTLGSSSAQSKQHKDAQIKERKTQENVWQINKEVEKTPK